MDEPLFLVISLVIYPYIIERNVANCYIKEIIRDAAVLISAYLNTAFLVELLCYPSGYGINFDTVCMTSIGYHIRLHSDKISDSTGRFKDIAVPQTHLLQSVIDRTDDNRRSIKGCPRAASCRGILIFC